MTKLPDFLPGSFYLVEFADLRRPQVVFAIRPMADEEVISGAIQIIEHVEGETPAPGERVRLTGSFAVDGDQSRRFVVDPAIWPCVKRWSARAV